MRLLCNIPLSFSSWIDDISIAIASAMLLQRAYGRLGDMKSTSRISTLHL